MSVNYEKMKRPPADALKQISGGNLKNFTDINPQWRYEKMDEVYGACGIGWKYEITKIWSESAPDGQIMSFATVNVYTCEDGKWSDPIPGLGGSMIVEKDKNGIHPNDEGYKMAVTDALSVALKMLGVGADIYRGRWDGSKYKDAPKDTTTMSPADIAKAKAKEEYNKLFNAKDENGVAIYDDAWKKKWNDMLKEKGASLTIAEMKKDQGLV